MLLLVLLEGVSVWLGGGRRSELVGFLDVCFCLWVDWKSVRLDGVFFFFLAWVWIQVWVLMGMESGFLNQCRRPLSEQGIRHFRTWKGGNHKAFGFGVAGDLHPGTRYIY